MVSGLRLQEMIRGLGAEKVEVHNSIDGLAVVVPTPNGDLSFTVHDSTEGCYSIVDDNCGELSGDVVQTVGGIAELARWLADPKIG